MVSRALQGVFRSLRLYHGPDAPKQRMDALYRSFIEPGDLVFDIGAHTGDRVSSFRRLGARVVAVEPQPLLASALRHIHGGDPLVEIVARAAGAKADTLALHINTENPTVSTTSEAFLRSASGAAGWEGQNWDDQIGVDVVTLDALIARYGMPSFVKIDTEGSEDAVLRGLSSSRRQTFFRVYDHRPGSGDGLFRTAVHARRLPLQPRAGRESEIDLRSLAPGSANG